jgi:hypothetical protein
MTPLPYPNDEGPRYARAAEASAQIINVHSNPDDPAWKRYRDILYVILWAMNEAEEERHSALMTPSKN